jgi:AraC-like DNA-binding protein
MTASLSSKEVFAERLNAIAETRLADHRFGVSALAREMEMSRSTLHRKVKQVFHESASMYISHKRLERARQLLLDKKYPLPKRHLFAVFTASPISTNVFTTILVIRPEKPKNTGWTEKNLSGKRNTTI